MFVRKTTYDRALQVAEDLSANANQWQSLSQDLLRQLEDSKRRHAITETDACNQASRANDLQRQLDALKPPRAANGKFCARTQEPAQ